MAKTGAEIRRKFNSAMKARVALEAIREQKTTAQIASNHGCATTQVSNWKKRAVTGLPSLFATAGNGAAESDKLATELYEQIGRLKMELEWLKKKSGGFA